jgi:hypothetical protein
VPDEGGINDNILFVGDDNDDQCLFFCFFVFFLLFLFMLRASIPHGRTVLRDFLLVLQAAAATKQRLRHRGWEKALLKPDDGSSVGSSSSGGGSGSVGGADERAERRARVTHFRCVIAAAQPMYLWVASHHLQNARLWLNAMARI